MNITKYNNNINICTNNSTSRLVGSCHEYGIRGDTVHVDARSGLDVIHVYVAVLGDQVDDVILGRHLHCHREIVLRLGGEENVDRFLWEWLISGWRLTHLYNYNKKKILYIY